ncbi:gamma-glutamylcyclotransferase family protein [Nocardioides sp. WS12]|uniref:gamma-glutamylcyclotransferase family protein n=1 Tax=Nocardioides sp. WS12 TaxID=2486272 RepID=UPI0015FA10E8|nr:gamma-glutamylcyclotransferase family protein [Nocardioides sp. WS12]
MPLVFGYGSLVDRESIEASLGRRLGAGQGPTVCRLRGFERRWNAAAHTDSRPGYRFVRTDGTSWTGSVVFLGLEPVTNGCVVGATFWVSDEELCILDARELSYTRLVVSDLLDLPSESRKAEPIYTYVPTETARAAAKNLGDSGVVMARYLRLIDRAFRSQGTEIHEEHVMSLPPVEPFRVEEILVIASEAGDRSYAIDPGMTPL